MCLGPIEFSATLNQRKTVILPATPIPTQTPSPHTNINKKNLKRSFIHFSTRSPWTDERTNPLIELQLASKNRSGADLMSRMFIHSRKFKNRNNRTFQLALHCDFYIRIYFELLKTKKEIPKLLTSSLTLISNHNLFSQIAPLCGR